MSAAGSKARRARTRDGSPGEPRSGRKEVSLWSGTEHVAESLAAYGRPTGVPVHEYLAGMRVIVRSDPVLVDAFGEDWVRDYESRLAEASRRRR